jgi:hypothetical protein
MKQKLIKAAKAILVIALVCSNLYCLWRVAKIEAGLQELLPQIVMHINGLEHWAEEQIAREHGTGT